MKQMTSLTVSALAVLALGACSEGGEVIKATDTTPTQETGENTLASVKDSIEAAPDTTTVSVDPAAANIDPFSGVYQAELRESAKESLNAAEYTEARLESSIDQTEQFLRDNASQIDGEGYEPGLRCAAHFDVASKNGALQAHEAQNYAKEVLGASAFSYEVAVVPNGSEDEREAALNEYRKQTYRNYFLVRDSMMEGADGEAHLAQAEACYEDLGLVMAAPEPTAEDVEDQTTTPAEG
ncbi:MAG: hypothetical protein CMK09_08310 [Ponticaulis sp.]|nr:hypothetical protein [Ponticaulis sp.]|tara:strand:+ start:2604 stop:3320 length:717 start_codon:yes stop_codon:yes gene_type:complete